MPTLQKQFDTRKNLIEYVKALALWVEGSASEICGGREQAERKLANIAADTKVSNAITDSIF